MMSFTKKAVVALATLGIAAGSVSLPAMAQGPSVDSARLDKAPVAYSQYRYRHSHANRNAAIAAGVGLGILGAAAAAANARSYDPYDDGYYAPAPAYAYPRAYYAPAPAYGYYRAPYDFRDHR